MASYDFSLLSPADFEDLVRDLLQAELGIRLEVFGSGRDQGIDARYAPARDQTLIVQAKHYAATGFDGLKRTIQNSELPKINRLAPHRYILATSVKLTPSAKDEILSIIRPWCRGSGDILGREDLWNLLGRHPEIEIAHHKLWLSSTHVLQRVLHHGRYFQAELEQNQIRRRLALYVQTPAFDRAQSSLSAHNYCVLSGIPGIGKTTLAEILITHLLDREYELVVANSSIDEALDLLRDDRKQVIYYDDFLGRSSLGDRLGKNEDRWILRLLRSVKQSSTKKLIFTTREYILAEARQTHELLAENDIDIGKCIVEVGDYTRNNRGRLLYNHLHFHGVPQAHIDAFVSRKAYQQVVDHRNFNPRIVEWMTALFDPRVVSPENYTAEFVANLENPGRLWRHAFDETLSPLARHLLLVMGTLPDTCPLECLMSATLFGSNEGLPGSLRREFEKAFKQVEGTFLSSFRSRDVLFVQFHSPSVRDFIDGLIDADSDLQIALMDRITYFEQFMRLTRYPVISHTAYGEERFWDAFQRGWRQPSASAGRTRMGKMTYYSVWPHSIGVRLERLADFASAPQSVFLLERVVESIRELATPASLSDLSVETLSSLFAALDRCVVAGIGDFKDLFRLLAEETIERLDRWPDSNDWVYWTRAVTSAEGRLESDQFARSERAATAYCDHEIEAIVSNSDSLEDAEGWADQLREVTRFWNGDIEALNGELRKAFLGRWEQQPDHEAVDHDGWNRREHGGSDTELDDLFSTLIS